MMGEGGGEGYQKPILGLCHTTQTPFGSLSYKNSIAGHFKCFLQYHIIVDNLPIHI